jgi:hypothetical protein
MVADRIAVGQARCVSHSFCQQYFYFVDMQNKTMKSSTEHCSSEQTLWHEAKSVNPVPRFGRSLPNDFRCALFDRHQPNTWLQIFTAGSVRRRDRNFDVNQDVMSSGELCHTRAAVKGRQVPLESFASLPSTFFVLVFICISFLLLLSLPYHIDFDSDSILWYDGEL